MLEHIGVGAALAAFAAGLLSFFSPCVAPLVPGYIGYLSGTTQGLAQPGEDPVEASARPVVTHSGVASFARLAGLTHVANLTRVTLRWRNPALRTTLLFVGGF